MNYKHVILIIMVLLELGLFLPVMKANELPRFLANSQLIGLFFVVYNLLILIVLLSSF